MRIGIVGAHGTGKTKLAEALSSTLGLPLVREVARGVMDKYGHPSGLDGLGLLKFQQEILLAQIENEMAYADFVSDRTVYDNLAYWVFYGLDRLYPVEYRLAELLAKHYANYDLVVYVPIEFPLADDGVRFTCEYCRNMLDALIRQSFLRGKVIGVSGSTEERCAQIVRKIRGDGE